MEMESTRRPTLNRSRELKKPRLAQPNPNSRPFPIRPPPPAAGGAPPASARFRAGSDRVLEDSGQTEAYQPQPQTYHELVNQYKTALAELTFNSKPIITNLTIIAGENLPAAKAIVATVCTNILEVPSEQKLPSLYLLDSIVKNIGRDYIRYFAARLPEVFCKAYRQVDPSVHPSMRHLFGTWKGVFPSQILQMIEKELAFASALNGSGAATSRPDLQSQRPQHSIHVNPKYLERQRLQQSSVRAKGGVGDEPLPVHNSVEDTERLDQPSVIDTGCTWVDSSAKLHNIPRLHREILSEPLCDKKIGAVFGDLEYGSSVSRNSSLGIGRTGRTVAEPGHGRLLYGAGTGIAETMMDQRNGFTIKHGLSNYPTPRSSKVDVQLQPVSTITSRSSSGMSSSWKNSEEEEFMWDMHSRLSEQDAAKASSTKDCWTPDDLEKEFDDRLPKARSLLDTGSRFDGDASSDSLSIEQKETTFGLSSPYRLQELQSSDKLVDSATYTSGMGLAEGFRSSLGDLAITSGFSLTKMGPRPSLGSHHVRSTGFGLSASTLSGSTGTIVPQQLMPASISSPTGQSLMHQRPLSPSFPARYPQQQLQHATEKNYPQTRFFPPLDNKLPKISANLLPVKLQTGKVQKMQPRDLPASSPSGPTFQSSHKFPSPKAPQSITKEFEHVDQSQNGNLNSVSTSITPSMSETSTPEHSNSPVTENSGHSSASNLLAAVMESGILAKLKTDGLPTQSLCDVSQASVSSSIELPLPSGPPSSIVTSSRPKIKSASSPATLTHDDTSVISDTSQTMEGPQPLPPGPPTSAQTTDVTSTPISGLLSSLVAKGLISASKAETSSLLPPQKPSEPETQKPSTSNSNATAVSSVPILPVPLGMVDKVSPSGSDASLQHISVMTESLIGLNFKPDVLRCLHPPVIDAVLNDLPQQCKICGCRLKIKEQLDRHLEWHAVKKAEPGGENKVMRRWYADAKDWVAGKAGLPLVLFSECLEDDERMMDGDEPMVLADEDQCICVLCGELFDDYYCQDKKTWLFRGAVHMTVPEGDALVGSTDESRKGPVVHASCLLGSIDNDLGIQTNVKLEKDASFHNLNM